MTPADRKALLDAATTIERVAARLSDAGSTCRSCGLHSFDDFKQANTKRDLSTIGAKLRKAATHG